MALSLYNTQNEPFSYHKALLTAMPHKNAVKVCLKN